MKMLRLVPLAGLILLAGCATQEPAPATTALIQEAPPPTVKETVTPRRDPLKHLAGRDLKPLPVKPLNARAQCSFRDPSGYRGRLKLDVKEANVRRFEASVDIPKRGKCSFRLVDFRQTEAAPAVVLAAKQGDCRVSLWEQADQVTVAFRDCRAECSGASVEYLWPILVNNRKGSCS